MSLGIYAKQSFSAYNAYFKESLINLVEFWQRQVFKFEALILSIVILWFKFLKDTPLLIWGFNHITKRLCLFFRGYQRCFAKNIL